MYKYSAKIIKWIDWDTLLVDIDLWFYVFRQERIRLLWINAEELRGDSTYKRRKAIHARMVWKKFCPVWSMVKIETHKNKKDMYARYLANVFFNWINLSEFLLEKWVVRKFSS